MKMILPSFDEEIVLWKNGFKHIAGVDEVGRGSFAGPLVAAAVILPQGFINVYDIKDSKLLSPQKREKLSGIIKRSALNYSIIEVSVKYINKFGITKANQYALRQVIYKLLKDTKDKTEFFVLVDGFQIRKLKGIGL